MSLPSLRCASLLALIFFSFQNTTEQSSDEEEELQQLQAIEQKLLTHDPTFTIEDTHAYISTKRSALISAFKPIYDEGDPAGARMLNLAFPEY